MAQRRPLVQISGVLQELPLADDLPPLPTAGSLTVQTTVNSTVTYTTGGITLAAQTAAAGSTWRVKARGTFVAVTSVTARNAQIAVFWGSVQLPAISMALLVSAAQTTNWEAEFELTATSTTAVWLAGGLLNRIASATALALTNAAPASTAVTAGAQTIDLRVSMSAVVATDQWVVQSVVIERLK